MIFDYPTRFFITSGRGISRHSLVAFDRALVDGSCANFNLVRVSSILPAGAVRADRIEVREGMPLLTAYAKAETNRSGERIATAVGVGIPLRQEDVGVIMEFSGFCSQKEAEANVKEMVKEAMENHRIPLKEILVSAIDAVGTTDGQYTALVSAIAFWSR